MRARYDFSTGVRGKYAGKVDTRDVRRVSPEKTGELPRPAEKVHVSQNLPGLTKLLKKK